jgi:hypothetical protein
MEFDFIDLFEEKKKKETQYFITEKRNMWIVEDSEGRSAIGKTLDEAKENFMELLNREYMVLKERVDRDAAESKRRHRELWNY